MKPKKPISRGILALLTVVALVAAALCVHLVREHQQESAALRELQAALEESTTAWQGIAAEKEALEAERDTAADALREATLSTGESTQKSEEITAQLPGLEAQLAGLTARTEAAEEEQAQLQALHTRLLEADKALQNATDALQLALTEDDLPAAVAARETLTVALREERTARLEALSAVLTTLQAEAPLEEEGAEAERQAHLTSLQAEYDCLSALLNEDSEPSEEDAQ